MSPTNGISNLYRAATIDTLTDGATYSLPKLNFTTPNVFSSLAFMDSLVVKRPENALIEDFQRYVKRGESGDDVRRATLEERDVNQLLKRFPEFHSAFLQNTNHAHFLMVHRLQYERLRQTKVLRVPQSRFIFAHVRRFLFFDQILPIIVQERVVGTPLLAMVEEHVDAIMPQWVTFLPKINPRLRELLASDLKYHINWFIRNFLYDPDSDIFWYVDSKPSCLFASIGNERNIQGLHDIFFKYE